MDPDNSYILYINSHRDFSEELEKFKRKNVRIVQTKVPSKIFNLLLIFLRRPKLDSLIKKQAGVKPDIMFVPDLRPTPLTKHTKKITVIHDLAYIHFPQFFSARSKIWFKIINPNKEMKESERLIAVSESTKKDLTETFKIKKDKIDVIYEAANENLLKITPDKTGLTLPEKFFLSLCTLEPRKNIHSLIEAYKKYKATNGNEVKLVIAGRFNEKAFARLELENDADIIFTGFVNKNQKVYLLKNAAAMIYPSLFEGFGLPILEAMIFATPIITSNASSMPEVAGDAALLINPKDTDGLATAMKEIQNPETREKLQSKMENQIKKFSWEKCARETLDTINKIKF